MKRGLKFGCFFTLALPFGCAFGSDQLKDDMSSTIQSLEAITSKVDEAPALLLLTPSQLEAVSPPVEKRRAAKPAKRPLSQRASEPGSTTQVAELKALQAKVNQLNAALGQQEQELKQLRQAARQDADARAEVAQLKQNLQENLQATEQMQQDLAAATVVKADNSKDNGRLQQALDKSLQQSSALQKQLDALAKSHSDNNQESKVLLAELNDSRKQNEGLQNQLVALQKQAGKHQLENSVLQQQLAVVALQKEELEPKSADEIRDYAIGSALAQDMLALLKERAAQGIEVDNRLALAGVKDTFAGKPKLQQVQIEKALDATEVVLSSNQQQQKLKTETAGSRYIEQFKKQAQVKKDASGYFYLVDSIGKGRIEANSIITVVVKESLENGKVIKDMDAAGTSITQPLSSFPPMFRSAITRLQNHGSMTMVVPPTLAYGDKGLPPDIPPGSTMVYNVKILDVVAPADTISPVN